MQYSIIKLLERQMIIDIQEGKIISAFLKTKQLPPLEEFNEKKSHKYIVYGAALHNKGHETIDHQKWSGYVFAYPDKEGYKQLLIADMHTCPTMMSGGLTFTPFAAIVESDIQLNVTQEHGISAFLMYHDMDIITNMLNRECLYAIRGIETNANLSNWRKNIDDAQLIQIALGIK
jgi:hypothetical protein